MDFDTLTDLPENQYLVPIYNIAAMSKKLDALVRRAKKLGASAINYTVSNDDVVQTRTKRDIWTGKQVPVIKLFKLVTVNGEAPKFNGWQIVARLLHTSQTGIEGANIINAVPGMTVPEQFRTSGCVCNHCNFNHIVRKDTYVVLHDDGTYKQVGSNCLRDFLGHNSPANIVSIASYVSHFDDAIGGFSGDDEDREEQDPHGPFVRGEASYDLAAILTFAQAFSRVYGWTSKAEAMNDEKKQASSNVVARLRFGWKLTEDEQQMLQHIRDETSEEQGAKDEAFANAAIAHAAALDPRSDFEHNVKAIANSNSITYRTLGTACAILGVYRRFLEGETKRKIERAGKPESNHVGTKGERLNLTLVVVGVRPYEGQFGAVQIHNLADTNGNQFIWWATARETLPVGETVNVVATIKGHDTYKGVKQTALSRVKLAKAAPTAEETAAKKAQAKQRANERKEREKLVSGLPADLRAKMASVYGQPHARVDLTDDEAKALRDAFGYDIVTSYGDPLKHVLHAYSGQGRDLAELAHKLAKKATVNA